ncbi:MAG: glycine cleavage system aminomethyltransferase GcvT [Candidatus Melainabacteria bacterium]
MSSPSSSAAMPPHTPVKQTPLCAWHQAHGARLVDFSGWQMPLQYGKVVSEHMAVREAAGLFDIAHMGLVVLSGADAGTIADLLNPLVPQDLTTLTPGKAVYTQFCNESGGIIDDIIVYRLPDDLNPTLFPGFQGMLVICNAGNTDRDMAWMRGQLPDTVTMNLMNPGFSLLALQGPRFAEVLRRLDNPPSTDVLPDRFHLRAAEPGGIPVLLSRTGYTGEDGVEIIVANAQVSDLWEALLAAGQPLGVAPVGLAARDTLRLEAAYPLHGHDISESDTPLEAGLGWSLRLKQTGGFIGKAALTAEKANGSARQFVCFRLNGKSIPRQHDALLLNGEPVGEVTSGSISPVLNAPIGMGYVRSGSNPLQPGDTLMVRIRGSRLEPAEVVARPFYRPGGGAA